MHTVALDAIKAPRVWLSRDVAALSEKRKGLLMTVAAHLKRCGGIRSADECSRVRPTLLTLRRVPAMAAVASHPHSVMCAGVINRHHLARSLAVAGDAVVLALHSTRGAHFKNCGAGGTTKPEDDYRYASSR